MKRTIGSYNQRIAIMLPSSDRTATGAPRPTYEVVLGERWADVVPRTSREFEGLRQRHEECEAVYNIPGYIAVTGACRIVHDGQSLEIVAIETAGNRKPENAEEITLICKGAR